MSRMLPATYGSVGCPAVGSGAHHDLDVLEYWRRGWRGLEAPRGALILAGNHPYCSKRCVNFAFLPSSGPRCGATLQAPSTPATPSPRRDGVKRSDRVERELGCSQRRADPPPAPAGVGARDRGDHPAGPRRMVRRFRGGVPAPRGPARRPGHFQEAQRGQATQLLLRRLRPDGRGARRGPHLHLLRAGEGRRPDQPLEGPRRDAGDLPGRAGPVPRRHEGPHHVRRPVLDGPGRLPAGRVRRRDHRLRLRRGVDARDDPHGPRGAGPARRGRRLRQGRAHRRRPAGRGPGGRAVAVQQHQVHLALPGEPRDLVLRFRLRRQRPAGQEVLRAAHRLDHGP